jgi:hypothetical protein
MAKPVFYRQCLLERRNGRGKLTQLVSWIPTRFAVVGKTLKLKDKLTGEWVDGWEVINASSLRISHDEALARDPHNSADPFPSLKR